MGWFRWLHLHTRGLGIAITGEHDGEEAMIFGTAGLAAGLSVQQLLLSGVQPNAGKVLVSGASVGVGSIAVAILEKMGYRVTAITGRPDPDHLMIIWALRS